VHGVGLELLLNRSILFGLKPMTSPLWTGLRNDSYKMNLLIHLMSYSLIFINLYYFIFFPKTNLYPPLTRCSLPPHLPPGSIHDPPQLPSTAAAERHPHHHRRCPPSRNRQVTSSKIRSNATTGNFSLVLSGFSLFFWGIETWILLIMLIFLLIFPKLSLI
jgi:hypothetical protein